ncbi:MAG: OadG family protein [Butyrivibrio sp.]|nr:OadG family protein [Butyrivibrio sp.]
MKHKLWVLGVMISCLLGLTACGATGAQDNAAGSSRYPSELFSNERVTDYVNYLENDVFEQWFQKGITPENFEEKAYVSLAMNFDQSTGQIRIDDDYYNVHKSGYDSWYKSLNDLGYGSKDSIAGDLNVTDVKTEINGDGVLVAHATLQGTKRSALMEVYLGNDFNPTDIGVTVNKTTGEKLENAGLNTLLGMGMAFSILIIISLIISLFPVLFGTGRKKKESDKDIAKKAMDNTISQIEEQEELVGDAELVAVIAAAIAAYEGSGSTDGFRVRSIKKAKSNWKR